MGTKKNKPKTKPPAKKSAGRTTRKERKAVDLAEVRKDIANIVGSEATEMTHAVVDDALKGQLAPVKYLFEVAGLYPAAGEAAEPKPEEDSLARTLLRRLGLPEDPVIVPEDLPPAPLALPAPRHELSGQPADPLKKNNEKNQTGPEPDTESGEKGDGTAVHGMNPVE